MEQRDDDRDLPPALRRHDGETPAGNDLQRERALLRCLIDSVGDLIFIKDRDGFYRGCNKASERFIGIPESKQIGKSDFDFFDREKAEAIRKIDSQVLEEGKPFRIQEWVADRSGSGELCVILLFS